MNEVVERVNPVTGPVEGRPVGDIADDQFDLVAPVTGPCPLGVAHEAAHSMTLGQ